MTVDSQNRAPSVTRTRDFRNRVERRYDCLNWVSKTPAQILAEVWQPLGTLDAQYTDCYLVDQQLEGQKGPFRAPCEEPPILLRVYEQLNGQAETLIGQPSVNYDQAGVKTVVLTYWQVNIAANTFQVVGTTAAPAPHTDCLLKLETRDNDGTLRKITRTYINNGTLSDIQTLRFGGKVVVREITAIGEVPATPTGWALVASSVTYPDGREVYTQTFANGNTAVGGGGVIGYDTDYRVSPDQGTTGVTVITIQEVSAIDVTDLPTAGPPGYELISFSHSDDAGFKLWTSVWVFGQGLISADVSTLDGGKRKQHDLTSINAIPTEPTVTISGATMTLVQANVRNGTEATNGTQIFDYRWVEALGEVSRAFTNADGGSVDFDPAAPTSSTGPVVCTIRFLTALSVTADPTTKPAGFVRLSVDRQQESGYVAWVVRWGYGTGITSRTTEQRNNGKLVIYRQEELNPSGAYAPATPAATISGTVTLTDRTVASGDGFFLYRSAWAEGVGEISRDTDYSQSSDGGTTGATSVAIRHLVAPGATIQPTALAGFVLVGQSYVENDGVRTWLTKWGKGTGMVLIEKDIQIMGALVVYHRVALGAAPTTPTQTIGGTPTLFEDSVRESEGYQIFDYRWSEGDGQSSIETTAQDDGALVYAVTTLTAAAATPAYPGSGTGYLLKLEQTPQSGYFRNQAIYKKAPATITLKRMKDFAMPGLASFSGNDLIISPPNRRLIEADEEISYGTTQNADVPYSVEYGAYLRESYVRTFNNGVGESRQTSLGYILAGASGVSGTDDYYKGMLCDSFEATLNSSSPSSRPSGLTVVDKENQIYLVDMAGTVVYRRTKVSYTFP